MPSPGKMQNPRYRGKRESGGKTPFENPGRPVRPASGKTPFVNPGRPVKTSNSGQGYDDYMKPFRSRPPGTSNTAPGKTVRPESNKPYPVGGKKPGRGFGPGGRFGKGGWQRKARNAAFSYTERQDMEAERKKVEMSKLKKKAASKRVGNTLKTPKVKEFKQGPNKKQAQLLGEE